MRETIKELALRIKGFLSEAEGSCLYRLAVESSRRAPCLEIGSYCGRSTLFLAEGCRVSGRHPLFALDHHRGSVEQQPGQPYFDPELFDVREGIATTLDHFMRHLRQADLVDWVIPIVTDSGRLSGYWPAAPLGLVFVDGGHSEADAFQDFHGWSTQILPGGYLCLHDIFPDPALGGQAPYRVLQHALSTGLWEQVDQIETLGILRRRPSSDQEAPATPPTIRSTRYLGRVPTIRTDRWAMVGQDGGQSIDLGDETLFVFSDTLFSVPRAVADRRASPVPFASPRQGVFLANSAGRAAGRTLREALAALHYYTDEEGYPREILVTTPDERQQGIRLWPEHGILLDGLVYLYYLGIQTVDQSSIWGFRTIGTGLAVFDPQTGQGERITAAGDWCLWPVVGDDLHFGVQVLRDGDDLYVFGSVRAGLQTGARLARVKAGRITDPGAYEYLTAVTPAWGRRLHDAFDLGASGPDYSVSYNRRLGRFALLYVDGYQKALMLRTADALWGPYSSPVRIAGLPHAASSDLLYLGFEHPSFGDNDGQAIYLTYSQPHFVANSLVAVRFQ